MEKHIVFKLNGEHYSIPIQHAERVIIEEHFRKVPGTDDFILGIINYNNSSIPVMKLQRVFSIPDTNDKAAGERIVIITKHEEKKVGLLVDEVLSVKDVPEILPLSNDNDQFSFYRSKFFTGIWHTTFAKQKTEDEQVPIELVIVLNVPLLLSKEG